MIPILIGLACESTNSNKVSHEIVLQKHNEYKKQYGKLQQTYEVFHKRFRKRLQDIVIDESE